MPETHAIGKMMNKASELSQKAIIAKNLRDIRKRRHLTQMELANKSGVDFRQISRYESRLSLATADTLARLAQALNTTVARLMKVS